MSTSNTTHDQNMFTSNVTQGLFSINPTKVTIMNGTTYTIPSYSNTVYSSSKVNINENDILIQGKSLKTFMEQVEERLMIISPDLEKLEKYEALRNAYEQYKIIEALITEKG